MKQSIDKKRLKWVCVFLSVLFLLAHDAYADTLPLSSNRKAVEHVGTFVAVTLPLSSISLVLLKNNNYGATQLLASLASTAVIVEALKLSINKRRPNLSGHDSFPSGHTAVAFLAASFIQKRYGLKYALSAWSGVGFVDYSRYYAKKHYTLDVFVGALLGTTCSFVCTTPLKAKDITVMAFTDEYA